MSERLDKIVAFAQVNHMYYTMTEMAEELGVHQSEVSKTCKEYGIRPITASEKIVAYMFEHPDMSLEEIADNLDKNIYSVRSLAREHQAPNPVRKEKPVVEDDEQEEEKPFSGDIRSFLQRLNDATVSIRAWENLAGINVNSSSGARGFKDVYTQSKSPYGIASELYAGSTPIDRGKYLKEKQEDDE